MTARPTVLVGTALLLTVALGGVLTGGSAAAQPGVMPVGPQQPFLGFVNGHSSDAVIAVKCPGPPRSGQTGHPVSGQTVGIGSPTAGPASEFGFTGSRAHSIEAEFVPTTSVGGSTIKWAFSSYGNQPLPPSVKLPCTGTSTLQIAPRPTSPTARDARVNVTFEPICDSTVCPVDRARI